jgi:hypothetical protein
VFKRILLVVTAVSLVVGAFALPALAQEEEGSEEETPSCAEFVENFQRYLTDYDTGWITADEAAAELAAEMENALANGVVCSEAETQELANFIALIPRWGEVAEILATEYGL